MGGNAFEHTERVPSNLVQAFEQEMVDRDWLAVVPRWVNEKKDHGDIDVLVVGDDQAQKIIEWAEPEKIIKHPQGYNILMSWYGRKVQVDLTLTNTNEANFAKWYFSYNDLGNLIGRIAHRQGLKFGHDGLWYVYRKGDRVLDEIQLTDSIVTALLHLGWNAADVRHYARGFDTFVEMFDWVKRSEYFEESAYPLEHRNHKSRTRDKKRKVYNEFLAYLNVTDEYVPSTPELHFERHCKKFPHMVGRIVEADYHVLLLSEWRRRFGGDVIRELTGLEGKELGEVCAYVKERAPRPDTLAGYAAIHPNTLEKILDEKYVVRK